MNSADILIVTSRNVATAGGEFSLIKNRALSLEEHWGLDSDIVSLCNTNLGVAEGEEAFGSGVYVRKNFMNPFSLLSGYEELIKEAEKAIQRGAYKSVLLSGAGMLRYVDRIKGCVAPGTLVCADVHGYYGDGKLLAKDEPLILGAFHSLAAVVEEYEQKKYLSRFDRIFVVSEAYKEFLCSTACCDEGRFYVVPCAIGITSRFSKQEENGYRETYRKKYGVKNDEKLLAYSGGASSWQCLPETVDLWRRINERQNARLLILSGDKEGVLAAIGGDDRVLVDGYLPSELPKVFCAADYFIMLRADVPTNHYAYPNKFLEYAAARRPVIATPYVYDIAKQIQQAGIGILFDGDIERLLCNMDDFTCDPHAYDAVVSENAFCNTLKPFANDLKID